MTKIHLVAKTVISCRKERSAGKPNTKLVNKNPNVPEWLQIAQEVLRCQMERIARKEESVEEENVLLIARLKEGRAACVIYVCSLIIYLYLILLLLSLLLSILLFIIILFFAIILLSIK